MAEFRALGLAPWLAEQARQVGLVRPTPVQAACIPAVLQGECRGAFPQPGRVVLCGRLPSNCTLNSMKPLECCRELAYQISEQFRVLGKPLGLKDCVVPHVVVATPGRLADHLRSSSTFTLRKLRFLVSPRDPRDPRRLFQPGMPLRAGLSQVLDEADRLLEQGCADFTADLELILGAVPARRQTLLFSATLTGALRELRALAANRPFFWEAESELEHPGVVGSVPCPSQLRPLAASRWFPRCFLPPRDCQVLNMMLRKFKFPSVALHSMMKQRQRFAALAKFKSSIFKILIATDVAARGLDIPAVQLVINHNTPGLPKIYIHRVGRTARAGRKGMAITLVTQYDIHLVHAIEEEIKMKLQEFPVEEQPVLDILTQVNVTRRECEIVSASP
ncbi:DDX49 helicase, partial [Pteruthius melanotis]|nr:DDX49 helicase [Pteruthius melanotis]